MRRVPVGGGGAGSGDEASKAEEGEPNHYMVARSDGIYTYSHQDKAEASPVDGAKIAVCAVPPPRGMSGRGRRRRAATSGSGAVGAANVVSASSVGEDEGGESRAAPNNASSAPEQEAGASYVLVAATDSKSGRDVLDVFDTANKLVAFHVLLSPGHRALCAAGVAAPPPFSGGPLPVGGAGTAPVSCGGRSSAIVLTSGGSLVTVTEKVTSDKVSLLVQKNLYGAAISMAYADPSYRPEDIAALYRRHAEHLYRKNDFTAAMEQ